VRQSRTHRICHQRVGEEPTSGVGEKRPKSANCVRTIVLDDETMSLLEHERARS
jgi:hypothetical protein